MSRKIILNLAMSLDGYIADEKGAYDWISGDGDAESNIGEFFSFTEFLDRVDTIVMGRKAYEDCSVEDFKSKRIIVATSGEVEDYENVEFVGNNLVGYIKGIKEEIGRDIWLFGGGELVDGFIKADIVDTYIVGIIPIILGKGKPLFLGNNPTLKLHLDECTVQEGITILKYSKRSH